MARTPCAGRTRRPPTAFSGDLRAVARCHRAGDASDALLRILAAFPATDWGGRIDETHEGTMDSWRCAFGNKLLNRPRRPLSGCPLAVTAFRPEGVFEPVGDGDAAIGCAFGYDAFGPKVHCNMGPVVFAAYELVPLGAQLLLPGPVRRNQAPKGSHDEPDSVVKIRIPERRDIADLVRQGS